MALNRHLIAFSLHRPRLVMGLVLAATLFSALGFIRLTVDTDLRGTRLLYQLL